MGTSVSARIARAQLEKREADITQEVRRIIDAGVAVMSAAGITARPRVADIVAAAGVSNEAFYRHFKSKDALVAAILEDGCDRLCQYLAHQMAKSLTPADKVASWVRGVLGQATDPNVARMTAAVLWNAGGIDGALVGSAAMNAALAELLREPYASLGSPAPEMHAALTAHAVVGLLTDHLQAGTAPSGGEQDELTQFLLRGAAAPRRASR